MSKGDLKYVLMGFVTFLGILVLLYFIVSGLPSFKSVLSTAQATDKTKMNSPRGLAGKIQMIKSTGPDDIEKVRKLGAIFAYADALELCQKLKKNKKADSELLVYEAELYLGQKRYAEATASLAAVIRNNKDNAWAYRVMGDVLRETGKHDESVRYYEQAIKLDMSTDRADTACALFGIGRLYASEANYEQALKYIKKAISYQDSKYFKEEYEKIKTANEERRGT